MNMDPKHWILNIIAHLEKQQDCKFILILNFAVPVKSFLLVQVPVLLLCVINLLDPQPPSVSKARR